jgi:SAM-dependent methyltransferase
MIYSNEGNFPLLALLPQGSGRILDCGCGAGDNARILQAQGRRVTGITLEAGEKDLASRYCEAVVVADLETGLPQEIAGPYDLILFSHILEHLKQPHKILLESKKVLAPGGLIAVALPNVLHYANRFTFLWGKFEYSPDGGLMDQTRGNFPLWKLRQFLPGSLVKLLNQLANQLLPGLFGYQCLYLARPGDENIVA